MAFSSKRRAEFKKLVESGVFTANRHLFPSGIKTLRSQGCTVEPLETVSIQQVRTKGIKCKITFPPDWTP